MGFIPEREKQHLKELFEKSLEKDVRMLVFTQEVECEFCKENRELAEELAELSSKIKVEVYDFVRDVEKAREYSVDKIPALLLIGARDYGIRYFGMPSGYEFRTLIEDLVDVSKGSSRLQPTVKQKVKEIDKPVHIQVFVTPTCPYCPRAVRTAHQMSIENPNIRSDMVEALEFPQLANRYGVMAVPKIVINDLVSFEGALPEEHFLEHIRRALEYPLQTPYR